MNNDQNTQNPGSPMDPAATQGTPVPAAADPNAMPQGNEHMANMPQPIEEQPETSVPTEVPAPTETTPEPPTPVETPMGDTTGGTGTGNAGGTPPMSAV